MALADSKFDNLSVAYIDSLIDDANYSQKHQKILLGEYRFWRARLLNFETMCLQEPLSLTTVRRVVQSRKNGPLNICPEMDSRT